MRFRYQWVTSSLTRGGNHGLNSETHTPQGRPVTTQLSLRIQASTQLGAIDESPWDGMDDYLTAELAFYRSKHHKKLSHKQGSEWLWWWRSEHALWGVSHSFGGWRRMGAGFHSIREHWQHLTVILKTRLVRCMAHMVKEILQNFSYQHWYQWRGREWIQWWQLITYRWYHRLGHIVCPNKYFR